MRLILCFILFVVSTYFYGAQDSLGVNQNPIKYDTTATINPVEFNTEKIESYRSEKDFDYMDRAESDSWWTRFKKWLQLQYDRFIDWLFGDYKANTILAFFLQILPYLIIAAILGLVFWLFIRLNPGTTFLNDPPQPQVYYTEEEQLVRSEDISILLEAAINNGDYRMAVRYYYLQLLKLLNEKGIINYEYQKTNSEYLNEITQEQVKNPFQKVIRLYNFIWYGNFPVTREDFSLAQQSFKKMEHILNPGKYD